MTNCEKTEQFVCISCVDELPYSFVSHLSKALRRKGINDVVIDVDSDDLLSKESWAKVEKARVSVMVLPGNCDPTKIILVLDKFVKVLEFQRNHDQVVVPVLYGDSPLQDEWLRALDLRGLSPIHQSRIQCSDSKLVEEIVRDVYEKLFYMGRIGIYPKLLEIENMVCKQPLGIQSLGIWGMPGIGKTTLAEAVFDHISDDFDACCFIEDPEKVIHEKGLYVLLEEQFLKEKPGADSTITKLSLLKNKLNNKRVLVVLDDVHNPLVAVPFLGGFDWFSSKSLIIITSRDKQVLRLCRVNQIYEVQGLNEDEALQLFLLSASIKDGEEQNLLHKQSMKVIEYANGNPLALSIYGRELKGMKNPSEMENAFLELKRCPPSDIFNVVKRSYDTLSTSEKNIFLDIACFFNGENVDYVMQLLEGCGFFPHVGIDVLVEKRLVTISDNCVRMHNFVQDVGRKVINGETVQIERPSRLWEPWSIKDLLEDDEHKANIEPKAAIKRAQGTKEIEGMFLDTSNLSFDVKPTAFENMLNLRLLKIYCSNHEIHPVINFPNGSLNSLPNKLRLLHWENYLMKDLPQKFDPRHLVEINMSHSQLVKLWDGTKNLEMLKTLRLCHSQKLENINELLKAKNLEVIDLKGCTSLQNFPTTGQLLHLRDVNLSGCTKMINFPDVPPNIETLHLQGTGIRILPIVKLNGGELVSLSKFQGLSDALKLEHLTNLMKSNSSRQDLGKLICLELKDCSHLQSLPNMVNLELLTVLDLSGCSELETIQGFPRNLKELYLVGTAVREVPQLPQSLELLNPRGSRLQSLPNMVNLEFLKVLDLSGCSELKTIQGFPRNLKELNLAGTAVREVPQLPLSLELLNAHGSVSLKSIILDSEKLPMHYTFNNFFDLSPQVVKDFLVKAVTNVKHIAREYPQELNKAHTFSFCAPSHMNQNSILDLQPGSSVMARLNSSWRKTIVGFAMLVEVAFSEDYFDGTGFGISCVCRWNNKEDRSHRIERNLQCWAPGKAVPKVQKDHMFVFVDANMRPSTAEGNDPNILADLVVFEFFPVDKQNNRLEDSCTVTRCGVRVITVATSNTSLEDISPALSLDPMEVSGNEFEEVFRACYHDLQEMDKVLFRYIACLFNNDDVDLVAPHIARIDLDISSGLKVLANKSLIYVSSYGQIVMHGLLRKIGKEILHTESMLPGSSKDITEDIGKVCVGSSLSNYWKYPTKHPDHPYVTNLEKLDLGNCSSLKMLPSSVKNLHKLRYLEMEGCINLEVLPAGINLEFLYCLNLKGCTQLTNFPEISRNISDLYLDGTSIEEVPSSVGNFSRLSYLSMNGCKKLKMISPNIFKLKRLAEVYFSECTALTEDSWQNHPDGISPSLMRVDMSGNSFKRLPDTWTSIQPKDLILNNCRNLVSLPVLPASLSKLMANNCESLESLYGSFDYPQLTLEFINCFRLNHQARNLILQSDCAYAILPSGEPPEHFNHRADGSVLTISLPQSSLFKRFSTFKACIEVESRSGSFTFGVLWSFKGKSDQIHFSCLTNTPSTKNHLIVFNGEFSPDKFNDSAAELNYSNVKFEFFCFDHSKEMIQIKECGIQLLEVSPFAEDSGKRSETDYGNDSGLTNVEETESSKRRRLT